MRKIGFLLLFLLAFLPLAGTAFGETLERKAGVTIGDAAIYDRISYGQHSTVILTVTDILNATTIFYNWNETTDDGAKFYYSYYVDVNGFNGSIGQPFHFIGANLVHGDYLYKGFIMRVADSVFLKIILGNARDTLYYKEQTRSYTLYYEWDKATGLLTEGRLEYFGFGDSMVLKSTNVWEMNVPFWVGMATVLGFFSFVVNKVVPLVGLGLVLWFFSFIPLRIKDWYAVKRVRGGGQVFPPWLKMIVVSALVFIMLWLAVLWILGLVLGGF